MTTSDAFMAAVGAEEEEEEEEEAAPSPAVAVAVAGRTSRMTSLAVTLRSSASRAIKASCAASTSLGGRTTVKLAESITM